MVIIPVRTLTADLQFREHKAIQRPNLQLGPVLSDIESHMTAGHIYRDPDKPTWGHETTHGINSLLRNKHQGNINAFYVLNDKYVLINELNTTLAEVAQNVPQSLRVANLYTTQTGVYNLYMIQQRQWWNDKPSYVFDEWVAYANGALVSIDLKESDRVRSDIMHMTQFNVFSLSLAYTANSNDEQFKEFLKWHLQRTFEIIHLASEIDDMSQVNAYWKLVQENRDAEPLREFSRNYFGKEWAKINLGF